MKKISIVIFTILAAGIIFQACKKEENLEPKQENSVMSVEDRNIENKIRTFRDKIQNPTKSNETLTVDEALWNLEATMNYTYGEAEIQLNEVNHKKFNIQIPVNADGQVSITDASAAYDEILEQVRAHYHGIQSDEKNLVMVNLERVENQRTSGMVEFEVTSAVNDKQLPGSLNFGVNDHWHYGEREWGDGGYCDGLYVNQNKDSDAALEIQKKVHMRKGVLSGRYYYTDETIISKTPYEYRNHNDIPVELDNVKDYLLYCSDYNEPNFEDCLSPELMNFYLWGTEWVVYHYTNETNPGARPEGKSFISIEMHGSVGITGSDDYLHLADINYGILHMSSDPPADL